jgi:hypothetical protein
MADTTVGRRVVPGPWLGGDLAQAVGSRPRGVRECVRMLKGTGAGTSGEGARGCAAARRVDAEQLSGVAEVASACDGPRVQAQERACELKNEPALASSRWKSTAEGGASARRGGTPASSTSVEG